MDILTKSNQLKTEADEVIKKAKIHSFFNEIGEIVFVGSYELNLLYRRDIDLFVRSKDCSLNTAIDITKKLLESKLFQTVGFANCTDYQCPNGLPGYYWELIIDYKGEMWKFDVWYTAEKDILTINKTKAIKMELAKTPDARKKILELKDKLFDGVKYKNGMNGFKIYQSVLGDI